MAFRLSCPSCNTSFTLSELPADGRAACPRCRDVFPVRSWEETADDNSANPAPGTRQYEVGTNRSAILLALGLALTVLVAGLVVYYNRHRQKPQPEPEPMAAV